MAGTKGVPRGDREQQILDVACAEFGGRGYAHASIAEIARRAGISKPLIYGYFDSKDGLYLACLRRAGTALVAAVGHAQHGPAAERAVATLTAIFATLEDRRFDWSVVYDPTLPTGSAAHKAALGYQRKLARYGFEGTQEALSANGPVDAMDQSLLTRIWFSAVSAAVAWWAEHPDESATAMTDRCQRIVRALSP